MAVIFFKEVFKMYEEIHYFNVNTVSEEVEEEFHKFFISMIYSHYSYMHIKQAR